MRISHEAIYQALFDLDTRVDFETIVLSHFGSLIPRPLGLRASLNVMFPWVRGAKRPGRDQRRRATWVVHRGFPRGLFGLPKPFSSARRVTSSSRAVMNMSRDRVAHGLSSVSRERGPVLRIEKPRSLAKCAPRDRGAPPTPSSA